MSIQATQQDTRWTPPANRGEIDGNSTTQPQITSDEKEHITDKTTENHADQVDTTTKQSVPEYIEELTAEQIRFTRLVSKGMTLTSAYRKAFPHKNKLSYDTIRRYAHELYAKENIRTEVATVRDTQARLARLSEDRIEEILTEGDVHSRGTRVPDVAMFMYDHVNGKARQTTEVISKSISVNIDLTQGITE